MKRLTKLVSIFLLLATFFSITACQKSDFVFNINLSSLPTNIDPQLATTENEITICRNLFRGLVKMHTDGKVALDLAENYTLDNTETVYTFVLRDEFKWSNDEQVTANDFVFAVKRLATTKTENSNFIKGISNATEIIEGTKSVTELGVKAIDSKTLEITLAKPDSSFLSTLCNVAFMPCNQAFFEECQGTYGLTKNSIITNGYYSLQSFGEKSLRLKKTFESKKPSASIVNLTVDSSLSNMELINSGDYHLLPVLDANLSKINSQDFDLISSGEYVSVIVYNRNCEFFDQKLVDALNKSIDRETCRNYIDKYSVISNNIFGNSVLYGGKPLELTRESDRVFEYAPETAREEYLKLDSKLISNISGAQVCGQTDLTLNTLKSVVSCWQQNLGIYFNIKEYDSSDYYKSQSNSQLVYFIKCQNGTDDVMEFLEMFVTDSKTNYFRFSNNEYDLIVSQLASSSNDEDAVALITKAESILIESGAVVPMTTSYTHFVLNNDYVIDDYFYDKTVDFSKISIK